MHLTIKKLKNREQNVYFIKLTLWDSIKGVENLRDQLFSLEANFEELNMILRLLYQSRKYNENEIKEQTQKKIISYRNSWGCKNW